MLCATSFTLVLVLGGGPAATTLEVAIYQALRFDFDPGRAVLLSFIQVGLTLMVMLVLKLFSVPTEEGQTSGGRTSRPDVRGGLHVLPDAVLIGLGLVFVAAPMLAVLVSGLSADLSRLVGDPCSGAPQ
jgi:thiamine transport system permease protein